MTPSEQSTSIPQAINRRTAAMRLFAIPAAALSCSGLLAGQWSSSRKTPAVSAVSTPPVFRGYVAGFQFHDGPEVVGQMTPGDDITLVREPANRHDANAIRIDYRGRKIGYVPQSVSEHVSWQLGDRSAARGTISAVDAGAVPWRAVQIRAV